MDDINGVSIDSLLAKQIPRIRKAVLKQDKDKLIIVDGREGSGKSNLAMQLAKALDPNFNIDKIAFNHIQFENLVKDPNRKKGDAVVLDEAFGSANSRATMSGVNRALVTMGTEMRQLNLFVILVLPSFFDLDKYFAIHRSETLLHTYYNKQGKRGQYVIFPFKKKKLLYLKGKKFYNYGCVKSPYPACAFPKTYVVDELEYRRKKAEAFRVKEMDSKMNKYKGGIDQLWKGRLMKLCMKLKTEKGFTISDLAKKSEMDYNVLQQELKAIEEIESDTNKANSLGNTGLLSPTAPNLLKNTFGINGGIIMDGIVNGKK